MIAQALQVTLTLLLVLAVIGAVAWLAQAARKAQPRRDQALQVRASVALGAAGGAASSGAAAGEPGAATTAAAGG